MPGPLHGVRVLDLTRILAGPTMTQIFADLGADVIKIERPGRGDDTRQWGPPFLLDEDGNETDQAGYYLSVNRGKHSLALDIRSEKGRAIVRDLAAKSDVVAENFKVGGLKKIGLDYESLKAVNPALVYLSITGFGQTGPDAAQPGYDYLIQARAGLMSITGHEDGAPGAGPMRVGVGICDLQTGLMGAVGTLAALLHARASGEGQHIDISLLDTQVAMLVNQGFNYLVTGRAPGRTGDWHPNLAPYQPFETADDTVVIAVGNDGQFRALCDLLGEPWADEERFATNPARVRHRKELAALISVQTVREPAAHWLDILPKHNVPACPVNDIAQVFEDRQVLARGMKLELDHPLAGTVPGIANPLNFSATPTAYEKAPPLLGEDSRAVLSRVLEMDEDAIDALAAEGVIEQVAR